jgi:hypothetical protein
LFNRHIWWQEKRQSTKYGGFLPENFA